MLIESSHKGNCARVRQMANVGSSLSGFKALHHHTLFDTAEGVNHDLTFHRLNWIHNDSHSSRIEVFLLLLSLNISA